MARQRKTIMAFAVFSKGCKIETARTTRADAEGAARIIGGTDWPAAGFTVEPVEITRFSTTSTTHPDMING